MCNPPGEGIDGYFTPGFACLTITVNIVLWERCRALAGIDRADFGKAAALQLPPAVHTYLEHRVQSVLALLRSSSPFAGEATTELVIEMITTAT